MTDKHNPLHNIGKVSLATALTVTTLTAGVMPAVAADQEEASKGDAEVTQPAANTHPTYTANVPLTSGNTTVTFTEGSEHKYFATANGALNANTTSITVTSDSGQTVTLHKGNTTTQGETLTLGVTPASTTIFTGNTTVDGADCTLTLTVNTSESGTATPIIYVSADGTESNSVTAVKQQGSNTYQATISIASKGFRDPTGSVKIGSQTVPVNWRTPTVSMVNGEVSVNHEGTATTTVGGNTVIVTVQAASNAEWSVTLHDGTKIPLEYENNTLVGSVGKPVSLQAVQGSVQGSTLKAVSVQDGERIEVPLTINTSGIKLDSTSTLGQLKYKGTANISAAASANAPAISVTAPVDDTSGTAVTLSDGTPFTYANSEFTVESSNFTLNDKNQPNSDIVSLTNGARVPINWDKNVQVVTKDVDGAPVRFVRMNGFAPGSITQANMLNTSEKITQDYTVNVTADRVENTAVTKLTVTQTNAKGESKQIEVPDFAENKTDYTITLPHSAVGDSYGLSATAGVDAQVGTPKVSLNGANRVLSMTINNVEYKVTVAFAPADIVADSPAKLTGIYVNYTGDTQGDLIEGWNPNRLDYTIALKDANQSPYILPVAPEGVSVKAGNVTQSAQSTRQEWVVTDTASGASRTYSVTVVRPVRTAVTQFNAKDPVVQLATVKPSSVKDTSLASVGYVTKDGKYVPVKDAKFTIPEGGTYSYEPKVGQSATVTSTRSGMTYTYTVNVLAADGTSFAQHVYTATYITPQTHAAQLTGIVVDGAPVSGFNADKLDYTVRVNDPAQWTLVAQYDKDSGMSVKIDKNGADATLTVTSGDGLVSRTYKVHAERKLFGGAGTVGVGGELANTGMGIGAISALFVALLAGGAFAWMKSRKPQVDSDNEQLDESKPVD